MSFLKCSGVMSRAVKLLSPVVKRRTAVVHRLIGSKKTNRGADEGADNKDRDLCGACTSLHASRLCLCLDELPPRAERAAAAHRHPCCGGPVPGPRLQRAELAYQCGPE